jgi:hypothetical protein
LVREFGIPLSTVGNWHEKWTLDEKWRLDNYPIHGLHLAMMHLTFTLEENWREVSSVICLLISPAISNRDR